MIRILILSFIVAVAACDQTVMVRNNPSDTCGNGTQEASEGCDDGNTINTDACTNSCQPASALQSFGAVARFGLTDADRVGLINF